MAFIGILTEVSSGILTMIKTGACVLLTKKMEKLLDSLMVPPGKKIDLRNDYDPGHIGHFMAKDDVEKTMAADIQFMSFQQDKLYAQDTYALLIIIPGNGRGRQGQHHKTCHVRSEPPGRPGNQF